MCRRNQSETVIHQRRNRTAHHQRLRQGFTADFEIVTAALGLRAPIGLIDRTGRLKTGFIFRRPLFLIISLRQ